MKTVTTPEFISFSLFFLIYQFHCGLNKNYSLALSRVFSGYLRKRLKGVEPFKKG